MISRLPVYSGKKLGTRVPPDMVFPVFVLVVLFFALLISYPWEIAHHRHPALSRQPAVRLGAPTADMRPDAQPETLGEAEGVAPEAPRPDLVPPVDTQPGERPSAAQSDGAEGAMPRVVKALAAGRSARSRRRYAPPHFRSAAHAAGLRVRRQGHLRRARLSRSGPAFHRRRALARRRHPGRGGRRGRAAG